MSQHHITPLLSILFSRLNTFFLDHRIHILLDLILTNALTNSWPLHSPPRANSVTTALVSSLPFLLGFRFPGGAHLFYKA